MVAATKPSNVIAALSMVMAELPAIGKDAKASAQQGGYSYRGIEAITAHTQTLFAKYGVVFVPRVIDYEIRDIIVNSKPWTDTVERIEYDVYGPGGIEDKITVGPILAIGRDNSDKGSNKALTQAFKYALIQTLCISDAKDDADAGSPEADAHKPSNTEEEAKQRLNIAYRKVKDAIAGGKIKQAVSQDIAARLGADIQTVEGAEDVAAWVIKFTETGELPEEVKPL